MMPIMAAPETLLGLGCPHNPITSGTAVNYYFLAVLSQNSVSDLAPKSIYPGTESGNYGRIILVPPVFSKHARHPWTLGMTRFLFGRRCLPCQPLKVRQQIAVVIPDVPGQYTVFVVCTRVHTFVLSMGGGHCEPILSNATRKERLAQVDCSHAGHRTADSRKKKRQVTGPAASFVGDARARRPRHVQPRVSSRGRWPGRCVGEWA